MARELSTKTIEGKEYAFQQFGAKQGVRILLRIGKIVGKPMALAFGALGKKPDGGSIIDGDLNGQMLGDAVEALMSHADEDEVEEILVLLCASSCLCNGAQIDFNSHYQAKYGLMFRVLQAALEVQYGNFLDALLESGALKRPAPASPAISNRKTTT